MPCLIAFVAASFPRLVLLIMWLFTDYMGRAFHGYLFPLLGFIFLPVTTLAYAFAINTHGSVEGIYLVVVIIGVLLDLGIIGNGGRHARRKNRD